MAGQRERNRALIDSSPELSGLAATSDCLTGQRLLRRQDACTSSRASHTKDATLQRPSAILFSLPQGSQVRPTFRLIREDQRHFFSFGGNYPKICSPEEICCKAMGRVPGTWPCYHPQGTVKADTERQSRDWDSKQHLCHDTYVFQALSCQSQKLKGFLNQKFYKACPHTKNLGVGRKSQNSFWASSCKYSNISFCFMEQIIYNK